MEKGAGVKKHLTLKNLLNRLNSNIFAESFLLPHLTLAVFPYAAS